MFLITSPVILHIMFPRVAAPIAVAPPVLPTNMIVDTSEISLIIAVNIIGAAKLVSGASLDTKFSRHPGILKLLLSCLLPASNNWTSWILFINDPRDAVGSIEVLQGACWFQSYRTDNSRNYWGRRWLYLKYPKAFQQIYSNMGLRANGKYSFPCRTWWAQLTSYGLSKYAS